MNRSCGSIWIASVAEILGVPISDTFQALQSYLGGFYINDFNLYGRTFRVVMQAEAEFRQTPEDLQRFTSAAPVAR